MKTKNVIREKTFKYADRIIQLAKYLKAENEWVFSYQILKSGTSFGANVEEAIGSSSRKNILLKLSYACKEARGTHY
jgi:four helix bundle protein